MASMSMIGALACGSGAGIGPDTPECGDGVAEGTEACDGADLAGADCAALNLGSGALTCSAACTFVTTACSQQATCGNGVLEYPEGCDGDDLGGATCASFGFDHGTLTCGMGCEIDASGCSDAPLCPNGAIDAGEACDGENLNGATCASLNLGGGELACDAACQYDFAGCDVQPECGNTTIEGLEVCDGTELGGFTCLDQGFYAGDLACRGDCLGFDTSGCVGTCGDALLNGDEVCDGTVLGQASCLDLGYYGGELGCLVTCADYDLGGCVGTCGDGVRNGDELCDGDDVGLATCMDYGFYGGSLGCGDGCHELLTDGCEGFCGDGVANGDEACDGIDMNGATCGGNVQPRCLGDCTVSCVEQRVLISELVFGWPDWVELHNAGTADVELGGWTLETRAYDQNDVLELQSFTLPAYTLSAGQRVVFYDQYQTAPGPGANILQLPSNISWTSEPGAAVLYNAEAVPLDFVRWDGVNAVAGPDMSPPAGVTWSAAGTQLVGNDDSARSWSRVPEGVDTNGPGDFCRATATPGTANGACLQPTPEGSLLITEVADGGTGQPDRLEIYNASNVAIDLGTLAIRWTGTGNPTAGDAPLPAVSLAAGAYVAVLDNAGYNDPWQDGNGLHIANINWAAASVGSCEILDVVSGQGIDFVRWGGSTDTPTSPTPWTEAVALPGLTSAVSLGRSSLTDTDAAADWCRLLAPSWGAANGGCAP
jgi:hypothetical protein